MFQVIAPLTCKSASLITGWEVSGGAAHTHKAPWRPLQPGGGGHLQALMADSGSSCKVSRPCDTWAKVFMDEEAMKVAKSKLAPEPSSLLPSAPSCWSHWLMAGPGALGHLPDGAAGAAGPLPGLCWTCCSYRTGPLVAGAFQGQGATTVVPKICY